MVVLEENKRAVYWLLRMWCAELKRRRELVDLKQEVLAEITGIPQQTISKIENGRYNPSLETLVKLAQGLGANPAELFQFPPLRDLPPLAPVEVAAS